MGVMRSRTKVVYFRVSEAEFERYMEFCRTQGIRSISDLARAGLENLVTESQGYTLSGLTERVAALNALVERLSGSVQSLLETVNSENAAHAGVDREGEGVRKRSAAPSLTAGGR